MKKEVRRKGNDGDAVQLILPDDDDDDDAGNEQSDFGPFFVSHVGKDRDIEKEHCREHTQVETSISKTIAYV